MTTKPKYLNREFLDWLDDTKGLLPPWWSVAKALELFEEKLIAEKELEDDHKNL